MDSGLRLLERCLQGFAGEEKYLKGFFYKILQTHHGDD